MYHHGGWKDVTKFTHGCDLAQSLTSAFMQSDVRHRPL